MNASRRRIGNALSLTLMVLGVAAACKPGADTSRLFFKTLTPVVYRVTAQVTVPVVTATPVPTATQPVFMGASEPLTPGMRTAVEAGLRAVSPSYRIVAETRSPEGAPVVWVEDPAFPDTLFCGSPVYFEGLGSVMMLSSTNGYDLLARRGFVTGARGCALIRLEQGASALRELLEIHQALHAAYLIPKRFDTAEELYADVAAFRADHAEGVYAQEIHLVYLYLAGEDLHATPIDLKCRQDPGLRYCVDPYRYAGVSVPFTQPGQETTHVAVLFAEYLEAVWAPGEYQLGERGDRLRAAASPSSALNRAPYSTVEALTGLLATGHYPGRTWAHFVAWGASGMLQVLCPQSTLATEPETNAFLLPLIRLAGMQPPKAALAVEDMAALAAYVQGEAGVDAPLPVGAAERILAWDRRSFEGAYVRVEILEEP